MIWKRKQNQSEVTFLIDATGRPPRVCAHLPGVSLVVVEDFGADVVGGGGVVEAGQREELRRHLARRVSGLQVTNMKMVLTHAI